MSEKENNKLVAEFMGSVKTIVDYTDYEKDGSIKYTANEDGSKWMVDEYSEPKSMPIGIYWGHWKHGDKLTIGCVRLGNLILEYAGSIKPNG